MANSTLLTMVILILCIDAVGFLGQVSMDKMDLGGGIQTGADGGILKTYNSGNYTINNSDPGSYLTGNNPSVGTSGNIIADTYNDLINWFKSTANAGWTLIMSLFGGPYPYLVRMGLPNEFTFAVGAIWLILSIILAVAFIAGRTWV